MYEEGKGVKQDDLKPRREQPLPSFKSHAFW
jgi:hypothetical protein